MHILRFGRVLELVSHMYVLNFEWINGNLFTFFVSNKTTSCFARFEVGKALVIAFSSAWKLVYRASVVVAFLRRVMDTCVRVLVLSTC